MAATLCSCGSDVVKLWNVSKVDGGALTQVESPAARSLRPHAGRVNCGRFNHNGQVLVTCADDGSIVLTHVAGSKQLATLPGPGDEEIGAIASVCFSSGSRYLCSGGSDRVVRIWDLKKRVAIRSLTGHTDAVTTVRFTPQRLGVCVVCVRVL